MPPHDGLCRFASQSGAAGRINIGLTQEPILHVEREHLEAIHRDLRSDLPDALRCSKSMGSKVRTPRLLLLHSLLLLLHPLLLHHQAGHDEAGRQAEEALHLRDMRKGARQTRTETAANKTCLVDDAGAVEHSDE